MSVDDSFDAPPASLRTPRWRHVIKAELTPLGGSLQVHVFIREMEQQEMLRKQQQQQKKMGRGVKRMQEVEEGWAGGCFPCEERAAPVKNVSN